MVHSVRTAYGDSLDQYGGDLWILPLAPPPQGLGQGNNCAPYSWVLVSTPTLNALQEADYGAAFKCIVAKKEFCLVGYCFVNDTTMVQMAPSPFTHTTAAVKVAQAQVDLYEGLAQATGGQGRVFPFVAHKILGVWQAPNGNSKQQVKKLQKKTEEWADRVRSGHIPKADAWLYYTTTIQKSLKYPLLASTLSEEDCPLDSLGLDCQMLYITFLFQKLRALLDHGTASTITGQHLWC
eukprot:8529713-Ditylum_brightwellii.AAC.1